MQIILFIDQNWSNSSQIYNNEQVLFYNIWPPDFQAAILGPAFKGSLAEVRSNGSE